MGLFTKRKKDVILEFFLLTFYKIEVLALDLLLDFFLSLSPADGGQNRKLWRHKFTMINTVTNLL